MLQQVAEKLIYEIVDKIAKKFNPEKIILFGSYAHGTPNKDSDLDLLVIMDSDLPPHKRAALVRSAIISHPCSIDIVVRTPEEIEKYKDIIGTIIYPALKFGKVIYERGQEQDDP